MIGIGKWECSIDTMMFRATAVVTIAEKDGKYDFKIETDDVRVPPYRVSDIVENGNNLSAVVTSPLLPGKEVPVSMDFDGDTVSGYIKVPVLGKVKLKNGKKIG